MEHRAAERDGLAERERQMLEFEAGWARHGGAKNTAIRERFAMSTTRYYQLLNALIDTEPALRFDPLLVHRLQRIRKGERA